MVAIFGILSLAGLALYIRQNERVLALLVLFLLVGTAYLSATLIEPAEDSLMLPGIVGILVSVHFVAGQLIRSKWLKWLLPPASIIALFLSRVHAGGFAGYAMDFGSMKVTSVLILGWLIGVILDTKSMAVKKWFPRLDETELAHCVQLVAIGLFVIPATFFASWYGLLLLATGFYTYNCYSGHRYNASTIALAAATLLGYFTAHYQVESIDLSIGKVLAGLFIGAASASLIHLGRKGMPMWMSLGMVVGAAALLLIVLLFNNVHPAYGGIEAFLAAMAGFSIVTVAIQSVQASVLLFPLMVTIGLTLPNDPFEAGTPIVATDGTQAGTEKAEKDEAPDFASSKGMDATELEGDYQIEKESALISFQLGPKGGVTKGQISGFEGSVRFGESVESTRFEVTLPVKNLTTFNDMRDESLMEDIYFNEPKFPVMKFLSTKMTPQEDGYVLDGNFTMLGKTKPEKVFVKYVENRDGKRVFVGESSIDKTKYGMASSPQEGDVVDFEFRIVLIK